MSDFFDPSRWALDAAYSSSTPIGGMSSAIGLSSAGLRGGSSLFIGPTAPGQPMPTVSPPPMYGAGSAGAPGAAPPGKVIDLNLRAKLNPLAGIIREVNAEDDAIYRTRMALAIWFCYAELWQLVGEAVRFAASDPDIVKAARERGTTPAFVAAEASLAWCAEKGYSPKDALNQFTSNDPVVTSWVEQLVANGEPGDIKVAEGADISSFIEEVAAVLIRIAPHLLEAALAWILAYVKDRAGKGVTVAAPAAWRSRPLPTEADARAAVRAASAANVAEPHPFRLKGMSLEMTRFTVTG